MSKIIICLILLISFKLYAQDISTLVEFEKQFIIAKNDTSKNNILLEKFNYCLKNELIDSNTLILGKRINYQYIKDKKTLSMFFWNMSLLALLNNDLSYAINYESKYVNESKDTSIDIQVLNFFIYQNNKSVRQRFLKNLIEFDTIFKEFSCLDEITQDKIHLEKYVKYSKLLPGLGTFLLDEKRKGITSFALTGLTTYAVEELLRHKLYINALGFALVYWLKFYQGNYLLTEEIIYDKIAKKENDLANQCKVVFSNLLKRYPLNFK